MTICDECNEEIKNIPFHCRRCGGNFCSKHRLPEDHNCVGLKKENIFKKINYKNSYHNKKRKKPNFFDDRIYRIKFWLSRREHRKYTKWNRFFMNIIWLIILSLSFSILYSNIEKLNEIKLWFIMLGSTLLLVNAYFWIRFCYKLIKKIYYLIRGERNWIRYLVVIILLVFIWQAYTNKGDVLNPVFDIYDKTNLTFFNPFSFDSLSSSSQNPNNVSSTESFISDIKSSIMGPEINDEWVHNFMSIINDERSNKGIISMQESDQLNNIADSRFNKMMESPFISHYGAEMYNVGEVVFYPEGFTEEDYINDIKESAPLHWDLLVDPMFSRYGYHVEKGPTIQIIGSCPATEIPGPNIDEKKFFEDMGCQITTGDSIWLVIDMT